MNKKHSVLPRRKTADPKVSRTNISTMSTENTFTQCISNLWKVLKYICSDMKIQKFEINDKRFKIKPDEM